MRILQPDGWKRPTGYSNGIRARGDVIFVAGQVGWDADERIVGDDFADQVRQALHNVVQILKAGGARPKDVTRMTWYVTDLNAYRTQTRAIGKAYREHFKDHYPAMTLVQVAGLVEDGAKVEIEATAVIPDDDRQGSRRV